MRNIDPRTNLFAESKPVVVTASPQEAVTTALGYRLTPEIHPIGEVRFNENLQVQNGQLDKITEWGFYDFINSLGISRSLAKKLPNDLLLENVHTLMAGMQVKQKHLVLLRRTNGEIATIIKPPFRGVQGDEVLTLFGDMPTFEDYQVGEDMVQMAINLQRMDVVEPAVGDITKIGFKVLATTWRPRPVEALLYLYRLVCTNGAVAAKIAGSVSIDFTVPSEQRLPLFRQRVNEKFGGFGGDFLNTQYRRMMEDHYTKAELVKYWNKLSYVVGTPTADTTFGLNKGTRGGLFREVYAEGELNKERKLRNEAPINVEFGEKTQWEVYNSVTSLANDLAGRVKFRVQSLGGEMIAKRFSLLN